ncbi:MAG TPA: ATP-binding protein [Burkholderiales bacterium]|nr:ATP-binding protein [Burkholderiales bacterium]
MNLFHDLSIGQRLSIGFGLLFCVLAALLGSSFYWHERSSAAEEAFEERIQPLVRGAEDLERAVLMLGIAVRSYLLRPAPETLAGYEEQRERARSALDRLRVLPMSAEGQRFFDRLAPSVLRYIDAAGGAVTRPAAEAALGEVRETAERAIDEFSTLQKGYAEAALARMGEARRAATRGIAVAGGAAFLLFAVLALLIARSIRGPAKALVGVADALRRGDWQPALAFAPPGHGNGNGGERPAPRSEMGQLAQAFGAAAAALEHREARMQAHRAVAEATATSLDKATMGAAALQAICEHVRAEVGVVYWHEDDRLRPVAQRALADGLADIRLGEGIPGQAARDRRPVVVRDVPAEAGFNVKLGYDAAPPRSVVAVPLTFRGELLGVLQVASLRRFDDDAVSFLEVAAGRLAMGLENVRAYQEIRALLAELEHKSGLLQDQNEELQAQSEEIHAQNEELQAQGEEIHAQNEQLKEQTQRLRAYAESLAEADQRKNEFLGVLAHELRNPMAAITNSLHTLANSPRAEARERAHDVIGRQTRLLTRLIDDLLDVTRIARGKIALQRGRVDLAAVVRECVEDYRAAADKAGVAVALELSAQDAIMEGDRARLCQVVGNLLDNAIKFAGEAGRVEVTLAHGAGATELRVADGGAGMDEKMLGRLFRPFSQADTTLARGKGGLGLGLALTKALVELHGGSIEARSDGPGRGAEFLVRLPDAGVASESVEAEIRQPIAGRPRRVLIVEDNADAGLTLKDALELDGHDVRIAYDSDEAWTLAEAFAPEAILCDIGLPTLDGYQLAQRLRADERFRATFMIAVTGYAGPDDQQRAAQAGFDRHFGKPPDLARLRELLLEHAPAARRQAS